MTRKQFLDAADRGRPVRLKDRSRCFYEDEWYRPHAAPDGRLAISAHTGEQHDVDDTLLDAQRNPQVHTSRELNTWCHDPNDGVSLAVETYDLSNDVRIRSKLIPPYSIRHYCYRCDPHALVRTLKITA